MKYKIEMRSITTLLFTLTTDRHWPEERVKWQKIQIPTVELIR